MQTALHSSKIIVGKTAYTELNEFLEENQFSKLFLLVDTNTYENCYAKFLAEVETDLDIEIIEIDAGETHKNIETALNIWNVMVELGADRQALMINLGGGVITDLGGFIASTFKRGIEFINVPTTLLAMVDAAIGGKTGVNLEHVKNQVGTITFPVFTLVDADFLETLPERELVSGFAEMLKHGLIANTAHWNQLKVLETLSPKTIEPYIQDSIEVKVKVTEDDPNEKGLRKILNFGHTIGHAIESEFLDTKNALLHGEAIAIGMLIESYISFALGYLNKQSYDEVFYYISEFYPTPMIEEQKIPNLLKWMKFDKKNEQNELRFTLIESIGKAIYNITVSEKQVIEAIQHYNSKVGNISI